jgi:hypothetical protein
MSSTSLPAADASTFGLARNELLRARTAHGDPALDHKRFGLLVALAWAITWLPLFLLALAAGRAWSGPGLPFLHDAEVQLRFLLATPLLIWAEAYVDGRLGGIVAEFEARGLVPEAERLRWKRALESASRVRKSIVIESVLLALAIGIGLWRWRTDVPLRALQWYEVPAGGGALQLIPAAYWYALVSLSLFRFLLLRWVLRFVIWYRFLWQVSRIPLRLDAMHPDLSGGIGFLAGALTAFFPVLSAMTVVMVGSCWNRIAQGRATIQDLRPEVLGLILMLMILVTVPLLFFWPQLNRTKRAGSGEFGRLASRYVQQFRERWKSAAASGEDLLGNDIQTLADLKQTYATVRQMRTFPSGKWNFLRLFAGLFLPFVPLLLMAVPLERLVERILGRLF